MSSTLQTACVQMCSGNDFDANLNKAGSLLSDAAYKGAKLALLPENFSFMGATDTEKHQHAETEETATSLAFLSEKAQQHQMWIVGGSVTLKSQTSDKLRNTCPVFSPKGNCVTMYDKIHLFDVELRNETYRESDLIVAGNSPATANCNNWKVGLSICYDIRFPELYRQYAQENCQILTVPAAFTSTTGKAHWQTLLKARAIENQCYVLAAGQCGEHPGNRKTWGHSMIIDPWGEVLAELGDEEGIIIAPLHKNKLNNIRQHMPALQHRKM